MTDPLVNAAFEAPLGWRSAHMQTLRSRLRPARAPTDAIAATRLVRVPMNDGTGDRLGVALHTPRTSPGGDALVDVVLLIHGLGGSSESPYILATAARLLRAGIAVARLDLRGVGRSGQPSQQMYHAGRTADVRAVVESLIAEPKVARLSPAPQVGVMGFSLGGNVTLKLLGEGVDDLPVAAGAAVSAPLDLAVGAQYLHGVAFGMYERAMLRGLRRDVAQFAGPLPTDQRAAVAAARRIEEFDDAFTARLNGWRDAAEYYAVNSSAQYLPRIGVPTLVIHAVDDPVVPSGPYRSIDWEGLERRGFVRRQITANGGHVGFHQRGHGPPWYAERAAEFFGSVSTC